MKKSTSILAVVLLTTASTFAAVYSPPAFPPPGGVTFSGSGLAINPSGRTGFYTGFNPASYAELAWTFSDIRNPRHSSQPDTGPMNFSSYNPGTGIALWQSSANLQWTPAVGSPVSTGTQLLLQFQPYTGVASGQLGGGWLSAAPASSFPLPGLPASWAALDVDALPNPDNYQVWFRYETLSGTPLSSFYNQFQNPPGSSIITSASGGFYSVVPEPTALSLLGIGVLGLSMRRRS